MFVYFLPTLLVLLVPPPAPVTVSFYTERYIPNVFAFLLLHASSLFAPGSVADPDPPDPYVFGPFISYCKITKKTLISTVL
jgi:hypothetical protein